MLNHRQMVANHLDDGKAFYCNFLPQPIAASHDPYNADTEAVTALDVCIGTVVDPAVQAQLRWEKYISRFRDGGADLEGEAQSA